MCIILSGYSVSVPAIGTLVKMTLKRRCFAVADKAAIIEKTFSEQMKINNSIAFANPSVVENTNCEVATQNKKAKIADFFQQI